jgi:hypothetical protein
MYLRRSQKSVQNLTLLEYASRVRSEESNAEVSVYYSEGRYRSPEEYGCGICSGAEDIHAYSEGRRRRPEEYDANHDLRPNSILDGKVSSISKFAKKKGMCDVSAKLSESSRSIYEKTSDSE